MRALLCGIAHPAAKVTIAAAVVTANSPVLAVISVLPSGELGSGCELAHPGRPRCDGHHRMGEFPAFVGLVGRPSRSARLASRPLSRSWIGAWRVLNPSP